MEVNIRLVLLDLSVAFDTVDLHILTDTLNVSWHLWVRWFSFYRSHGSLSASAANFISPSTTSSCAVVHGSVLRLCLLCVCFHFSD